MDGMVEKPLRRVKSTCHRVYLDCGPPSTSDIWQQIEFKTLAQSPPTPRSKPLDSSKNDKTSKHPFCVLILLVCGISRNQKCPPVPLWQREKCKFLPTSSSIQTLPNVHLHTVPTHLCPFQALPILEITSFHLRSLLCLYRC